jgi:excisionase family DNA binding protein
MSTLPDPQNGSAEDPPVMSYTIAEAASRLGISKRAVMRQIQNGTLPAERAGAQWAVLLPASARSAEPALAPGQPASQPPEHQAAGAIVGARTAGQPEARQGRPPNQIEQAIERFGEQHSIRLRALTEQIRQHSHAAISEHPSAPDRAIPFERQLETPPESDPVDAQAVPSSIEPPAPTENEPGAPAITAERQWEPLFTTTPVLTARTDSPPSWPQSDRPAHHHSAPTAAPNDLGWREHIAEWWQDLLSRYAYRSRLILAMVGVTLLLVAILGCAMLLLFHPSSHSRTAGMLLGASTPLPAVQYSYQLSRNHQW